MAGRAPAERAWRRAGGGLAAVAALALAAGLVGRPASARPAPDTLAERVQACVACHGREGRATPYGYFPRIAGKPAGYLFAQLQAFRDGRRANPLMAGLVRHLSDDYLREIAGWFAAQDVPWPPPASTTLAPDAARRAESLVRQGDRARALPACARCHGESLTGVQPDVPGLLGLPRDYLSGELGAWRSGARHARAPDCMRRVAAALTPAEVGALSAWLSAQPLPADPRPAAARAEALPMRCGLAPEAVR